MLLGPTLPSARRVGAYAVPTSVWPRLRTAQGGRHLAIVVSLFVASLAAQPFLGGAGRFDAARFAGGPLTLGDLKVFMRFAHGTAGIVLRATCGPTDHLRHVVFEAGRA